MRERGCVVYGQRGAVFGNGEQGVDEVSSLAAFLVLEAPDVFHEGEVACLLAGVADGAPEFAVLAGGD